MPPQIEKAGAGGGTVVHQAPPGVEGIQPRETERKPAEVGKAPEDPKAAARAAQGSKGHATEQRSQRDLQAQVVQNNLHKQVQAAQNPQTAQPVDPTGLKKGEKISARVTTKSDGFHFQFDRSITKEQAGSIIFQDGKVPQHARLEGSGKDWTVKTPNSAEARQNTVSKFNKREETIKIPERRPTDVYQPDPEVTNTWTGGELKTAGPGSPAREQRLDLKNDMGFTIKNHYELDQGQRHREKLGLPGMGYEVGFEKPMTKAQVMDKLFDKEKVNKGGEIRLIPKSKEPASEWKVELIGVDAAGAFKTDPGHAFSKAGRAFSDANVYGKQSLPSDTPPGIRAHLENRTIPPHAEKLKQPGKDGKDVYVWEQDGYMMYVKTNNKGKDGYYEAEAPTKMPNDKSGQIWMRHYVKERGMAPREAWQSFWQDAKEIAMMEVGMVSGAVRPVSGSAHVPTGSGRTGRTMRATQGRPIPVTHAPGSQRAAGEPRPAGWHDDAGFLRERPVSIRNAMGEAIEMPKSEYRNRVRQAEEWIATERASNPRPVEKGKTINHLPSAEEARRAAVKFGLDLDWARVGNKQR